jgi:hypothetical protein
MAVSGAGARTCPILSAATTTALTTGLLDGGGLDSVAAVHFVKLVDGEFVGFNVRISHVIPLFLRRDHSLMHGGRREYMARFIGRVLRVTHRTRTLSDSSQDARDQIRTAPNTPVLAEGSLTLGPGDLLSRELWLVMMLSITMRKRMRGRSAITGVTEMTPPICTRFRKVF